MGDCGYQDVECWERQLRSAGWLPWSFRRGIELRGSTTWKSPEGNFYRGPYGAWLEMNRREAFPTAKRQMERR